MSATRRRAVIRWAGLWRSKNLIDGVTEHLLFEDRMPKLFRTRAETRKWIEDKYGYIRTAEDLKHEPHGWKVPIAIKVKIESVTPMSATQERRERAAIQRLKDAIGWAETYYPLPRCEHGSCLQDGGGELLEPECGMQNASNGNG